jgi:hypothetical protein
VRNGETLLLYQVPEFVIFLKNNNYYQYMEITPTIQIGTENRSLIASRFFDKILINSSAYQNTDPLFFGYQEERAFDSYLLLKKI